MSWTAPVRGRSVPVAVSGLFAAGILCAGGLGGAWADESVGDIVRIPRQSYSLDMSTTVRKSPLATRQVPPKRMYETYLAQYELGPDSRWGRALLALIKLNARWNKQVESEYSLGEADFDGQTASFPLLKRGQLVVNLEIPTYADFPEGLAMLKKAVSAMEWAPAVSGQKDEPTSVASLKEWADRLYSMDPRGIITALVNLEAVRAEAPQSMQARLFTTAALGYVMLGFSLSPDIMEYSDECYASALAYLSLAGHLDPGYATAREDGFLAMQMGYRSYAHAILSQKAVDAGQDRYAALIMSYLTADVSALIRLHKEDPLPLSFFLLGRLYRDFGLWQEARDLSEQFLKSEPMSYASVLAAIKDGDLVMDKTLTVLYPLDILQRVKKAVYADADQDGRSSWGERAKALYGAESTGDVSFQQFGELLAQWSPWGDKLNDGMVIDNVRIRDIYRALYEDALYSRFVLLNDRWNVPEQAAKFVASLENKDSIHPLVLYMRLKLEGELGRVEKLASLCGRVIRNEETTSWMALRALRMVGPYLDKIKYAPQVFRKFSGKPAHMLLSGDMFYDFYHYDMAEKMYSWYVQRDPLDIDVYKQLEHVRRDPTVIDEVVKQYPDNYKVLFSAGDFYSDSKDPAVLEKALICYDKAAGILSTDKSLLINKASVLSDLGRHAEAVGLLKSWLERYGRMDMSTLSVKTDLASNYRAMKDPKAALEVLTPEVVASYKADVMVEAALAYEDLKDEANAEDIFRKVVERYPSSNWVVSSWVEYLLKHKRDQEATQVINTSRTMHGEADYSWYFGAIRRQLSSASDERVLKIVDALAAGGALGYEITGLAAQCFQGKPRLQFEIVSRVPVQLPMEMLERITVMYRYLKAASGVAAADAFVDQNVPPQAVGPWIMILYKNGESELMLRKLKDLHEGPKFVEFDWLERVLAWESMGRLPAEEGEALTQHYQDPVEDPYNLLGRFLMGLVSLDDLLGALVTDKQRCEFSYYIGLSKRLAMRFEEAANWYFICLETQLRNNGELHWANDELFWWAHAGTRHRNRLMREDLEAYNRKLDDQLAAKQ
ncbi:MAG: tetratricopeptide repeat protein [Candidatus Omnitrophica bacterium]|nr:tetratricopeptide repeat protein [Candidatus Omnitrophota bacterium]